MTRPVGLGIVLAGLGLLITAAYSYHRPESPEQQDNDKNETHFAYYMQSEFYTGIEKPDQVEMISGTVLGGIVSHHFFVERNIAKYFAALKAQKPSVVVLIGPNHFNAGKGEIIISQERFDTPWGMIEPDLGIINKLLADGPSLNEEQPFKKEHSISVPIAFIKNTFPDTKIVPVIVRRGSRVSTLDTVVEQLNQVLPPDALVIASVDFSHHVDNETAKRQDAETLPMLQNFDYADILKRTAAEMDSPSSIYLLLKYLDKRGARNFEYTNTNQALVSGNLNSADVTSYFFGYYKK